MNNIFANDMTVFFDDINGFAENLTYTQGGISVNIPGIINEVILDNPIEGFVEKQANIIIDEAQLIASGIAEPKPHDLINGVWEVMERTKNIGVYKLVCTSALRPKP